MSGFDESAQFSDGDQRHVPALAPMNDDRLVGVDCFIKQRLKFALAWV
jgi:hypothetical protein